MWTFPCSYNIIHSYQMQNYKGMLKETPNEQDKQTIA